MLQAGSARARTRVGTCACLARDIRQLMVARGVAGSAAPRDTAVNSTNIPSPSSSDELQRSIYSNKEDKDVKFPSSSERDMSPPFPAASASEQADRSMPNRSSSRSCGYSSFIPPFIKLQRPQRLSQSVKRCFLRRVQLSFAKHALTLLPFCRAIVFTKHTARDYKLVRVTAGRGGDGCISFFRDSRTSHGPANGGSGGRGGSVYVVASHDVTSLASIKQRYAADNGGNGGGAGTKGRKGEDVVIVVPHGTVVRRVLPPSKAELERIFHPTDDRCTHKNVAFLGESEKRENSIPKLRQQRPQRQQQIRRQRISSSTTSSSSVEKGEHNLVHDKRLTRVQAAFKFSHGYVPQQDRVRALLQCISPSFECIFSHYAIEPLQADLSADEPLLGPDICSPQSTLRNRTNGASSSTSFKDLPTVYDKVLVAQGGAGGLGNPAFQHIGAAIASRGTRGEECYIELELKLLADVGLVGFPNVGKSTLLRCVTNAEPKIGNYAFTTLYPNLGVVEMEPLPLSGRFSTLSESLGSPLSPASSLPSVQMESAPVVSSNSSGRFTIADIPGLIPGASENKGLGHAFLRHVERSEVLCFVVDITGGVDSVSQSTGDVDAKEGGVPASRSSEVSEAQGVSLPAAHVQFSLLRRELELYSPSLLRKRWMVVATKADSVNGAHGKLAMARLVRSVEDAGGTARMVVPVSSLHEKNLDVLKKTMYNLLVS